MAGRGALLALLILCCWAWSVYTQDAGDVRFSLNGTTYQNNSLVTLEDINEGDDALLCLTDLTACCRSSGNKSTLGDWYFPNGTRVRGHGNQWDIYRIRRGQGEVILNRRRGGEEGIYRCVIPDTTGVKQTIYIGVYTASSGFPCANYLRYDSQSRNLTCSSYGGPATTVTWKKDGALITPNATYQLTKRVVDPVQGIYQVELTIDSSVGQSDIAGIYYYTVDNARGRSSRIAVIPGNGTSEGVRFSLNGKTYQNNSLVTLEDIGEWDDALLCITDQSVCCYHYLRLIVGNWFFPNGTRVSSATKQWDFFRTRGQMVVNMHRRRGGVTGIYHCKIPDAMNVTQAIYIGVYTASTGQVTIRGEITFQLNTDPATDLPVFTLTCTSTVGPASTVSWRRDGTMLSDDNTYCITSQVMDAETATYTHTLTVTGRLVGEYQCSVSNIRTPSGSSRTLRVVAAGSPTNLNAAQVNLTSFSVSWTPPATSTGYQVYWSGGGGYDSGNMSARADDRTVTITGRTPGLTYNITIVAFSDHLPSTVVGAVVVTLACPQVMDSEYLVSAVVGTFIGTTLLYTVILLVSICALICWNKRHKTTIGTQVTKLDGAIVMKECDAYGEITVTGTDHIYAAPQ